MTETALAASPIGRPLKLGLLLAPAFLVCLGIMLLNDHVLKHAFPGFVTGKLSDFTGLFIFYLFFLSFITDGTVLVGVVIACAFIFWKIDLSTPVLATFNRLSPVALHRTVDPTDISAISVLPVAWWYARRFSAPHPSRWLERTFLLICPIIFMGQSMRMGERYYHLVWNQYRVQIPLSQKLEPMRGIEGLIIDREAGTFTLFVEQTELDFCYFGVFSGDPSQTTLTIDGVYQLRRFPSGPDAGAYGPKEFDMDQLFEEKVLKPSKLHYEKILLKRKQENPWEE